MRTWLLVLGVALMVIGSVSTGALLTGSRLEVTVDRVVEVGIGDALCPGVTLLGVVGGSAVIEGRVTALGGEKPLFVPVNGSIAVRGCNVTVLGVGRGSVRARVVYRESTAAAWLAIGTLVMAAAGAVVAAHALNGGS